MNIVSSISNNNNNASTNIIINKQPIASQLLSPPVSATIESNNNNNNNNNNNDIQKVYPYNNDILEPQLYHSNEQNIHWKTIPEITNEKLNILNNSNTVVFAGEAVEVRDDEDDYCINTKGMCNHAPVYFISS